MANPRSGANVDKGVFLRFHSTNVVPKLEWKTDPYILVLLERFLEPRYAATAFPSNWKLNHWVVPNAVLNELIDLEILVPATLGEKLSMKYIVPQLKGLLQERNLKSTGSKEVLIQRLMDNDFEKLDHTHENIYIYKCSQQASTIVKNYADEVESQFLDTTGRALDLFRAHDFVSAIELIKTFWASRFSPRGQCSIHKEFEPHEQLQDLMVLTNLRPGILKMNDQDWETLHAIGALHYLTGEFRDAWFPMDYVGTPRLNKEKTLYQLIVAWFFQGQTQKFKKEGIKKVKVVGYGSCVACQHIQGIFYDVVNLPSLPFAQCTCELGCRCLYEPITDA